MRTGTPFTPLVSVDISNTGTSNPTGGTANQNHPNRVGNGNLPAGQQSIAGWFDLSAFTIPANYTYGNGGRDILYGPGVRNLDLNLSKNFAIREGEAAGVPRRGVQLVEHAALRPAGGQRQSAHGG